MKAPPGIPSLAAQCREAAIDADRVKAALKSGDYRKRVPLTVNDMTAREWQRQRIHRAFEMGLPDGFRSPHHGYSKMSDYCNTPSPRTVYNSCPQKTMFALRTVREVLESRGFDPTEDFVEILQGEPDPENPGRKVYHVETEVRLRACGELMKFVHPTLKAVEMNTTVQLRGPALDERLRQLLARARTINEREGVSLLAPADDGPAEPEIPPRPFRAEDML